MTEYQAQDHPGRTAAAPSPGWYPDQAGVMRWWDGTGWGPRNPESALSPQPSTASAAAPLARAPFPWAWTVAATPLILLGVAAATAALGGSAADAGTYLLIGDLGRV